MRPRAILRLLLLLAILAALTAWVVLRDREPGGYPPGVVSASARVVDARSGVMGTHFAVEVAAPDRATGVRACNAAFRRIHGLEAAMSTWIPDSLLSRVNRAAGSGEAIVLDPDTFEVLGTSRQVWEASGGAFDPTVGPLIAVWKPLAKLKNLPAPEEVAAARALVGFDRVRLDAEKRTVELPEKGMRLDVGGIAKGYAADAAARAALDAGATACRVNAGGDLVASGSPPWSPRGFEVRLRDPEGGPADALPGYRFFVKDRGVATSGNYERYTEVDGKRYSHIVDPETGRPVEDAVVQVTVIADTGILADAMATALTVLGAEKGLDLAERTEGLEAIFLLREDGKIVARPTSGFPGGRP